MKSDRYVIGAALLLAAVYFYAIEQIPSLQIGDPLGAKAIPRLLGGLLVLSAGLLWLERRIAARAQAREPEQALPAGRQHLWVIAAVVVGTGVYFALFQRLGYAVATATYLLALMAYFNPGRWLANASTALLFSLASYLLFSRGFGAQLPAGVLPF